MIIVAIQDVQLFDPNTDKNIAMDNNVAGIVSQHLANAVIAALKDGGGFSIRETDAEVEITTTRVVESDVTETYVGQ